LDAFVPAGNRPLRLANALATASGIPQNVIDSFTPAGNRPRRIDDALPDGTPLTQNIPFVNDDATLWNGAFRWGLVGAPTGWQAVQGDDGDTTFIFVNNANTGSYDATLGCTAGSLPATGSYTVRLICKLTVPTATTSTLTLRLFHSGGATGKDPPAVLTISSLNGVAGSYVTVDFTMSVVAGGGIADSVLFRFNVPLGGFPEGFYITKAFVIG
jgi:hypothetical protein